jgi:hypothetical protein
MFMPPRGAVGPISVGTGTELGLAWKVKPVPMVLGT